MPAPHRQVFGPIFIITNLNLMISVVYAQNMINIAMKLCITAHEGQIRRGWENYSEHPIRVAQKAIEMGMSEHAIVAAYLHDVIEDTYVTMDMLEDMPFSMECIDMVELLTKKDGESSVDHINRIARSGNVEAIKLKLLDLEDNMDIRPNDYWPGMHESVKAYKVRHAFLTAVLKTVVRRNGCGR